MPGAIMENENTLTGSETPEIAAPVEKPVETPEVETQTDTEPSAEPADAGEQEPEKKVDEKPKTKSRAAVRLEEVLKENSRLKRQNTRLNQNIGKLRAEAPPREEDFSDQADYHAAKVERRIRESALQREANEITSQSEELRAARADAFAERLNEARTQLTDFDPNSFYRNVAVNEAMAEVMASSDMGAEMAYYFTKNPAEATRLYHMEPVAAAREMGRLEARLTPPKAKTVSSAPSPVPKVTGKAHQMGKTPDEMSYEEYAKWRRSGA